MLCKLGDDFRAHLLIMKNYDSYTDLSPYQKVFLHFTLKGRVDARGDLGKGCNDPIWNRYILPDIAC
jgi:hypothetical protein